jgi:putative endonuclease
MNRAAAVGTRAAGARYEELALAHLLHAGLVLLERNFCCRHGELDLVMRDRDTTVFVEVRYRRSDAGFGDGIDSVSAAKRRKLVRAAGMFLATHASLSRQACRFDVVAVAGDAGAPLIDWRQDAFDAC